jgi:prophage antirepressor-like protein
MTTIQTYKNSHSFDVAVALGDDQTKRVRVVGTAADPHFFGKDICDILDIKDIKDTLQKLVSTNTKKNSNYFSKNKIKVLLFPLSWGG